MYAWFFLEFYNFLMQVVKIIQDENSNAFKEVEKDRYQILVDNLNKDTFNKIWE